MKFSRLWRWVKQHAVVNVLIMVLVVFLVVLIGGYFLDWSWTGFNAYTSGSHPASSFFQREKTLWDWFQLLVIPGVLAASGLALTLTVSRSEQAATERRAKSEREAAEKQAQVEQELAVDNQREAILQNYIDRMSELLLKEHLGEQHPDYEGVRKIARVRTLTVLPRLDGMRKRSVLQFLQEADLIQKDAPLIDLSGADLSGAELGRLNMDPVFWSHINLYRANLRNASLRMAYVDYADLSHAHLEGADLNGAFLERTTLKNAYLLNADLSGSFLKEADLSLAHLGGANLRDADLSDSDLSGVQGITLEELEQQARSLQGATMRDGEIHP